MMDVFKTRRNNVMAIVLDKYLGNRAAFSRATEIHPNHINLVLSNNDLHRRNIGEDLARRIEKTLGLAPLWLDSPHNSESDGQVISIKSLPIQKSLDHVLRESPVTIVSAQAQRLSDLTAEATAVENLFLGAIATSEMEPVLHIGDTVIVDGAVKGFGGEGVYILSSKSDVFLRRVKKTLTGDFVISSGKSEERIASLVGVNVLGRVIRKIEMSVL